MHLGVSGFFLLGPISMKVASWTRKRAVEDSLTRVKLRVYTQHEVEGNESKGKTPRSLRNGYSI